MNNVESNFDFLRVSIESHLTMPSIVTITSAHAEDGSSVVASGLAEAFAEAGQPTLLVSTKLATIGALKARRSPAGDGQSNLTRATAEQIVGDLKGGRAALAGAVSKLRESYAVIVVDADPLPGSPVAYELARVADAVLLAIKLGRKPLREDATTRQFLEACKANVLGVVPTTARMHAKLASSVAVESTTSADALPIRSSRPLEVTR